MISRSHKIRLYPNEAQEAILRQTVGAARFAYNWALEEWGRWYQEFKEGKRTDKPSAYGLCKVWTTEKPSWASEVGDVCLRRAILNVGTAFTNFWKKNAEHPKFKKRGNCRDTFYVSNTSSKLFGNRVSLPKAGRVRMAETLRLEGKIEGFIVSCYAGRWYVSVIMSVEDSRVDTDSVVGIDVGMKIPAVASDGLELTLSPKLPRLHKRIRRLQRRMDRKQKASNNRRKALLRKQRVQDKINNLRADATHKFTSTVTKNHGTVVIETLNLKGMHRGPIRNIRAGFQRSCMGEIHRQLRYKAVRIIEAPRTFPSSQLCSCCGARQKLKITQRTYSCPSCESTLDRDLNAALNLKKYVGMVSPDSKPVEIVNHERGTPPQVAVCETGSII